MTTLEAARSAVRAALSEGPLPRADLAARLQARGQAAARVELRYIDRGGGDCWVQWRQSDDDPTWSTSPRSPYRKTALDKGTGPGVY